MTVSLLILIVWIFLLLLAVFLPYNSIRDLSISVFVSTLILAGIYCLDRFVLNFEITKATGESLAVLLSPISTRFKVAAGGVFTAFGTMFWVLMYLLIMVACSITVTQTTTGAAPWKSDRLRGSKRMLAALIFLVGSCFTVTFAAAGTRNLYYVKTGFLDSAFEALFPWEVCFL